ncbi:Trk system potassium transporter TrkA [Thermosulfuriphilus ammonigenes]|uniref:Trk system potassium uptake protein TrkA n=1 Tax=Thermosulfuriphilus ammonigenes TaxID=1936021 RepID=A0A6G7PTN6_9BACT|nr:Trk system potassium transporter TrkA [Thermosulfuriphilus ammonigenes]MBA2849192.1 trk system potassium uptake protein TrkA [Thermosulfuriphilus ammonigenes]QIJ70808.1 Trk system potassium transporter TrkA [Thermosulfuriphilus ammonigenes]
MRIVIVGAGQVGFHLSRHLSLEGHDVVVIDRDPERIRRIERELNVLPLLGSGASAKILEEAGIDRADLFIAVTNSDEVNLISCLISKEYGVKRLVARVRNEEYLSPGSPLNEEKLGIDLLINPDRVMAEEIVQISQVSEAFEVVEFVRGRVALLGYQVKEDNPVCGLSLAELKGLRGIYDFVVVAIVRDGQTIIPRGQDVIRPEDKIYVVVRKSDIAAIEYLLNFTSRAPKLVFIIGGGRVGFLVARQMEAKHIDVRLVETNRERCEELSERLSQSIILNFDGLDAQELIEEGIDQADLVIAVTDSDTTNILASLLAKHHGARKCITRIDRPDFIPLLGKLGIDIALSPRLVVASQILRFVRRGAILSVATLLGSEAEVVEIVVPPSKRFQQGVALKDLPFPSGAIVGAVTRGSEVIIPSGETILKPGDDLVIFSLREAVSGIEKIFAPE